MGTREMLQQHLRNDELLIHWHLPFSNACHIQCVLAWRRSEDSFDSFRNERFKGKMEGLGSPDRESKRRGRPRRGNQDTLNLDRQTQGPESQFARSSDFSKSQNDGDAAHSDAPLEGVVVEVCRSSCTVLEMNKLTRTLVKVLSLSLSLSAI